MEALTHSPDGKAEAQRILELGPAPLTWLTQHRGDWLAGLSGSPPACVQLRGREEQFP